MSDLLLPLTALMIAIFGMCVSVGGILIYRGSRNKGLSELDAKTIISLQAQNAAQEQQMKVMDKKIIRLERTISTVQYTLRKRRSLRLEINDDAITIIDERANTEVTVPIHISGPLEKEEKEN